MPLANTTGMLQSLKLNYNSLTNLIGIDLKLLILNIRWNNLTEECRLMHVDTLSTKIRLTAEVLMEIAATLYIFAALREARFLGLNMFIENLVRHM